MMWLCARMIEEPGQNTPIHNWFVMDCAAPGEEVYFDSATGYLNAADPAVWHASTLSVPNNNLGLPYWAGLVTQEQAHISGGGIWIC
jgi:hypothetical protein